jgi:hypothetical protein
VSVGLLAVAAAVATFIATRHGPLLSPDSVTYLSLAHNLVVGKGFVDLTGQANTTFAPGFPGVLAAGQILGLAASTTARALNAASFAGVVVLAWILVSRHTSSRHTTSRLVAFGATALVVVSPALLDVAAHAWSEPAFCVVVLGFILLLEETLVRVEPQHPHLLVAGAGLLAGVGFMTRYAALPLVLVGIVALGAPPGRARARVERVAVFLMAALPLPVIWLVRNATSGAPYLLGPRTPVPDSFMNLLNNFGTSFVAMFTPGSAPTRIYLVFFVPLVVLAAIGLIAALRQRARRDAPVQGTSIVPLVAFIAIYSVSILVSGKTAGSSIDTRIVMPIFVPVVVVGAWLVSGAFDATRQAPSVWTRRVVSVLAISVLVGVVSSAGSFVETAWNTGRAPRGYATDTLTSSPLARAVSVYTSSTSVVTTNSPWSLYSATAHEPILPRPGPLYPSASLVPASADMLADAACHASVYFAWYAHSRNGTATLGGGLRLTRVTHVRDGVLYMVHAPRSECRELRGS